MSGVRAKCRRGVGRALSEAVCRILTPPSSWSIGDGGFIRSSITYVVFVEAERW